MDIADLSRAFEIEADGLGPIRLDMRTVGFLRWAEARLKQTNGGQGAAFVRRLLADRGVSGDGGTPVSAAAIAALSDTQIEAIAAATMGVAKPWLDRRKHDLPEAGHAPAVAPPEAMTQQLLAVIQAYVSYQQEQVRKNSRRLQEALGFSNLGAFAQLNERIDKLTAIARLGGLWQDKLSPTLTAYDSLGETHRKMAALASGPMAAAQGLLPLRATDSLGHLFKPMLNVDALFPSIGLARDLQRGFGFDISKSMFAALGGGLSLASLTGADSLVLSRMSKPGFTTLAAVGLDGLGPRGAIADLLRHYGEPERAPIFGAVGDAVETLDVSDGEQLERLLAGIEQVLHAVATSLDRLPKSDKLSATALMGYLVLLLTIAQTVMSYQQLELSKKAQVETVQGPSAQQFASLSRNVGIIQQGLAKAPPGTAIRYLNESAPLRSEPRANGLLLRIVYPGQQLRVCKAEGGWAVVEVYDYASEQPITGWINRRRLRLVPQ